MNRALQEKRTLAEMARRFGQEPAPRLLAEIAELEAEEQQRQQREAELRERITADLTEIFGKVTPNELVPSPPDAIAATPAADTIALTESQADPQLEINIETPRLQDAVADYLRRNVRESTVVNPEPVLAQPQKNLELEIKRLEQWISRIAATGAGSGEVNFRRLDDVNYHTMEVGNDNWVLEYDAATKKVQFTKDIGPIDTVWFDPAHVDTHTSTGVLAWNNQDKTLNIHHPGDVIQQVGQEQYILVKNYNGGTIANGTFVRFAGAVPTDGEARILAAPMLANGEYPNLYSIGVATQDIPSGQEGFITTFGKVRGINTTGAPVGETWQVGDILYAHPTTTGALTRVKPTSPNNVLPVCAVLKTDATEGEIFVRPTFEQRKNYASFSSTQDQYVSSTNTGVAVTFNTVDVAQGFNIGSSNSSRIYAQNSGFYNFQFSLQFVSTNSSAKNVWIWFRKNDQDIANSATRLSINGNGVYAVASWNYMVSLDAGDWFQIVWAADDLTTRIDAPAATAFCPAIPSAILTVSEPAL